MDGYSTQEGLKMLGESEFLLASDGTTFEGTDKENTLWYSDKPTELYFEIYNNASEMLVARYFGIPYTIISKTFKKEVPSEEQSGA